jgi:hypothetical protein
MSELLRPQIDDFPGELDRTLVGEPVQSSDGSTLSLHYGIYGDELYVSNSHDGFCIYTDEQLRAIGDGDVKSAIARIGRLSYQLGSFEAQKTLLQS